jgi:hypothetical protein
MAKDDQRQRGQHCPLYDPTSLDPSDTDAIVELSLRLAKAARRRATPEWVRDDDDDE